MINCDFLIFQNCIHCIQELITLSSFFTPPPNYINALKTKWTLIWTEIHIIGWWTDTDSFMYGRIFILESITDIQNPGSESIHIRDRKVDPEGVRMCHGTVVLIKTNTLNMRTTIFTISRNKFTCFITFAFLNTWL